LKLAGQVVVVTGAGRGIGRAVALCLAREGAAVALAARSAPELDGVAREIALAGGRALAVPTDVRQEAAVEALARRALAEQPIESQVELVCETPVARRAALLVGVKPARLCRGGEGALRKPPQKNAHWGEKNNGSRSKRASGEARLLRD